MTYQEFLSRVQDHGGLASTDEANQAVTATLETLRWCLVDGGFAALPQEIRDLLPIEMSGVGATLTGNPQVIGETRTESGGETTASSGQ